MHKIHLLTIGRIKTSWLLEGCEDYLKRLQRSLKLEIIEIPVSKQKDPSKQREEESLRVLSALDRLKGTSCLLDERGERMTSMDFSFLISQAKDTGTPLIFLLGGAYGFTPEVRKKCQSAIRLSDMTFPHELCLLIFLEQLYRAVEMGKGSGYHH